MANPIFLPKRSNTASSVPTTSNLTDGELAINSADKKIFLRAGLDIVEVANADYTKEGKTYYVSKDGLDTNVGSRLEKPFLTVAKALTVATSGDTIRIGSGVFSEVFPLTVPVGVNVKGSGIRSTFIEPTSATKTNDGFLLNGETTVEDLTIGNMYEPGYAFKFATSMTTTTRSPYIQRVTVLNKGTSTSSSDPYGFSTTQNPPTSYKSGRGVLIDGSVVSSTTLEPAMLFNECTFICPNNVGLEMTNGARTEWVNCFTYFCDKAIYAYSGSTGLGGVGKTRVKISNISGAGSPAANDFLYYFEDNSNSATYSRTSTTVTITFNSHGLANSDRIYADFTSGGVTADGIYTVSNVTTNTFDITTSTSGTTTGNVSYKKALAYGTISAYSSGTVTLTGKGTGTFTTAASRSGKTVTTYGDAKLSTAQFKFGTASLSLDGTGDYARCEGGSDFSFSGDFTAECWVYPTSVTGTRNLIALGTETTGRYVFFLDGGVVKGNLYGNTTTSFGGSISTNAWTHLRFVRSGSTITAYVNGTALGTTETTSATIGNTGQMTIGVDTGGAGPFAGYIDEIRISNNARNTTNFTSPTAAFTSDANTKLLLHLDGDSGSVVLADSTLVTQDIRIIDDASSPLGSTSLLTATQITLADYQQFGASMRSIGSAAVFGNSGVTADGLGISLRLFAFNFGHIGSGGDFSQDESLVNQANEVIITNGAKVQFVSIDQSGDFRVGNAFYVNEEKGLVTFGGQSFNVSSLSNLTITDGTNSTTITPSALTAGNIQLSANTISTTTGNLTLDPAGTGTITINGDTTINGTLSATSTSFGSISQGNTSVTVTDTGANGTVSLVADGTAIQTITATGTLHIGGFVARAAANQDGVHLVGRAGGTGNFEVNITPTTLTADRTLTLADGNTTLQAGTMATTGGTLAQFASTTSSQLAGVISDETGSGSLVFATSPTLVTPVLGTPTSGTLSNCTGYPVESLANLGTGISTFLTTPSSLNLLSAVTDETGTGSLVFATSPTLVTPVLGTPTSGTLSNCTGYPVASLANLGTGVATFLTTPSSANLASAVTDETGTGALVFANTPTLVTPAIGAATGTSLTLSGTAAGTLRLSGTPPSTNNNLGFLAVGPALSFSDTNKFATFVSNVDSYAQLVVQNASNTATASADVVVNNNNSNGQGIYGDFGINSSSFGGGGAFGDPDGAYLYGFGGTLSVGTFGAFDFKIGTNNVVRITTTSAGNTTITGNTTLTLANALTTSTGLSLDTGTTYNASAARTISVSSNTRTRTINFIIDGGGALITTGVKGDVVVDFSATIVSYDILGDVSGSLVVDVSKASYANFPTFTASGGTSPTLTAAQKNQANINWTGFTTITAGDILRFTVSGTPASVTRATVSILVTTNA